MKSIDHISNTKWMKGVTLLELIVAVAVIAVLASMAVPAFNNQTKNARLSSNASMLASAYDLARSEAVNRGVQVKVEAITNGWAVVEVASAELIREFKPDGKDLTWSSAIPEVTYNPTGFRTFGSPETVVTITDDRGVSRVITISTAGSTKVEK